MATRGALISRRILSNGLAPNYGAWPDGGALAEGLDDAAPAAMRLDGWRSVRPLQETYHDPNFSSQQDDAYARRFP